MLFELVIFAVVLVTLQALVGLVAFIAAMKYVTSDKYIKTMTKMAINMTKEIEEQMYED